MESREQTATRKERRPSNFLKKVGIGTGILVAILYLLNNWG